MKSCVFCKATEDSCASVIRPVTIIDTNETIHVCMSTWAAIRSASISEPGERWSGVKDGATGRTIEMVVSERGYEC